MLGDTVTLAQNIMHAAQDEAVKHYASKVLTLTVKVIPSFQDTDTLSFCLKVLRRDIMQDTAITVTRAERTGDDAPSAHPELVSTLMEIAD